MILKDISFETPQKNILFDDVLLHLADKHTNQQYLRFWESKSVFIVLGKIGKEQDDLKKDLIVADNIPVLRRSSGGGTVVQGPGCLNYTFILSKEAEPQLNDITKSYQYISNQIVKALAQLDVQAQFLPISDIALKDTQTKISGNAQKRGRNFILHHGTILYDFDLSLIEKYLKMPLDMPEYRHKRNHLDFVANINKSSEDIKKAIQSVFDVSDYEGLTGQQEECLKSFISTRNVVIDV